MTTENRIDQEKKTVILLSSPKEESLEEKRIRQRMIGALPPAGIPLWKIDPEPTESGHFPPETEAE